jgi:3-phenylpropionate/trans-cinnamate dioxygenase ferredoxin reductase subunit
VSETTSGFYLRAHRRRGTTVVLGAQVVRITGRHGKVTGVELGDGTVVPADVVLVGVGVIPRTELAEQLGLAVDNGIVVDARALASDGLTVAAGDCANMPNPYIRDFGNGRLRLESVQNAVEQAKIAAATLLGREAEYRTVPWFWSDQADLKLQIAGLSAGHDQQVVRGDPETGKFSVLYYRNGRILAADCLNSPQDFMAVRNALTKGLEIPAEAAADTSVPLKKIAAPDTAAQAT